LYLCTLDAEKCFDCIWHDGLFFKLKDILPQHHWIYLLKWYRSSYATVRWSTSMSRKFSITRGMKQGSLLSPILFKIFLDDLMAQLEHAQHGVRISDLKLNCCTYADDITIFASTITGLQSLIDICVSYAEVWRMKFSETKSKCIVLGKTITRDVPRWRLYDQAVQPSDEAEILGVTVSSSANSASHVDKRSSLCR
jgi:retron-type reverse transcriptase